MLNGDFTEQYLTKMYDDLMKEHQRLMTEMRNITEESLTKESDIQKQLTIINSLMTNTLKLKNHKKKIQLKLSGN
jgi:hypothetical protein